MSEEVRDIKKPVDRDVQEGKMWAFISYLGPLCLRPLLTMKDNKFILFHAKQGLVLFMCEFASLVIVASIKIIGEAFSIIAFIVFVVYSFIGMIKSLQGEYWKAPIVSELDEKTNI